MSSHIKWFPSLLAANPLNFEAGIEQVVNQALQQVHLDIMDGHFVPNISFGPSVVKFIAQKYPALFLDVHLMLSNPENFIPIFVTNGAHRISIHVEIEKDSLYKSLNLLEKSNVLPGLAINPETPLDAITHYISYVEHLLVMSVHPGFSGQTFLPTTYERVRKLRELYPDLSICLDGGITSTIASQFLPLGINSFVVGASFFTQK